MPPTRQLSLLDSTSIIVGIIIGSGIYKSAPDIAAAVPNAAWLAAVWTLGGVLSLVGALCYAELATMYPQEGGDYVYLTRALGRWLGFLFAWAQFWIVRPGSIGAWAYVFADYAKRLVPLGESNWTTIACAACPIVVLTGVNVLGVREGKWTQNILTAVKVAALVALAAAALCVAAPPAAPAPAPVKPFGFAMIMVLYTYGGWNEMAYVGAEVRRPEKNILRALLLGTLAVAVIYVLVNLAMLHALGLPAMRGSTAVAADVLQRAVGPTGDKLICLLICISALGAINGTIFTGARIYYAMGTEHRLYAWLGRWSPRWQTPVRSLAVQAAATLALVAGFGQRAGGFESMVMFTTPVFWIFFFLVGLTLPVLRFRRPDLPRPFRVPLYPWLPAVFCLSSLFMLYSSLSFAIEHRTYEALWSVGLLLAGVFAIAWESSSKAAQKAP